jgi:hypothetical protein
LVGCAALALLGGADGRFFRALEFFLPWSLTYYLGACAGERWYRLEQVEERTGQGGGAS